MQIFNADTFFCVCVFLNCSWEVEKHSQKKLRNTQIILLLTAQTAQKDKIIFHNAL